jgi:parallel beta-helix repeat protein
MSRKGIILGLIFLLFVGNLAAGINIEINNPKYISLGNILYVDGGGSGDYTKIQDAIDNASNGDIIRVFDGIYYEHLVIDVSVDMIGNSSTTTIVDGSGYDMTIFNISSEGVKIINFLIKNSSMPFGVGILIDGIKDINISHNIFTANGVDLIIYNCAGVDNNIIVSHNSFIEGKNLSKGIVLESCWSGIEILKNDFMDKTAGILGHSANDITISNNTFSNCYVGIQMYITYDNNINYNNMIGGTESLIGIYFDGSRRNNIENNSLSHSRFGIFLENTEKNEIYYNNIISNTEYGIYLENSREDDIRYNNLYNNFKKELFAISSEGWFPWNWWGSTSGPIGRVTTIDCRISFFPWAKQEGPPFNNAVSITGHYLFSDHELFSVFSRLLQQLGLQ